MLSLKTGKDPPGGSGFQTRPRRWDVWVFLGLEIRWRTGGASGTDASAGGS